MMMKIGNFNIKNPVLSAIEGIETRIINDETFYTPRLIIELNNIPDGNGLIDIMQAFNQSHEISLIDKESGEEAVRLNEYSYLSSLTRQLGKNGTITMILYHGEMANINSNAKKLLK